MRRSILIADDEAENREVLGEVFARRGYRVALAGDGAEAIEKIKRELFSLCIFDYQMPSLGGIAALRILRSMNCVLPVVIMTSVGNEEVRRSAFEAGANDFFPKPLDLGRLRETVRILIGEETALTVGPKTSITISISRP